LPQRKVGGDMETTGGFFEYGIAALLGFAMMVGAVVWTLIHGDA